MDPLPAIRPELVFHPQEDAFHIEDPVANRFIRVSCVDAGILLSMDGEKGPDALSREQAALGRHCPVGYVENLIVRCESMGLLVGSTASKPKKAPFAAQLFFWRIPLLNPDHLLDGPARLWAFFCSRWSAIPLAVLILSAIYLIVLDLPRALWTGMQHLTPAGMPWLILTVVLVKLLHELGHAAAAKRHGCRVEEAGIIFLCFLPCLYCNTSHAWRLNQRRKRLEIGAAGVLVEMVIGALAAHVWYRTTPGTINSLAFHLMAVSWVSSLLFNLNPLMRFDGYYLLSDLLGMPNLATKSRARIQHLFWKGWLGLTGVGDSARDRRQAWILTSYGFLAGLYRILLSGLIAHAVYARFFKALGIVLMLLAIWFFLLAPMGTGLAQIWRRRAALRPRWLPSLLVVGSLWCGFLLLILPVSGHRVYPCVVEALDPLPVVAPADGSLETCFVALGDRVLKGDALFQIQSATIDHELRLAALDLAIAEQRLRRAEAKREERHQIALLKPELSQAKDRLEFLEQEREQFLAKAERPGVLLDWSKELDPGAKLVRGQLLGQIADPSRCQVCALLTERDLEGVRPGSQVEVWLPVAGGMTVSGKITKLDRYSLSNLDDSPLAARYGGLIPTRRGSRHEDIPLETYYRLLVELEPSSLPLGLKARLLLPGSRKPILVQAYEATVRHLYREILF